MASRIKRTGVAGSLLVTMASRGGRMTSDHRGFPPARVFLPFRRRGLVELTRVLSLGRARYSVWRLTPKGWAAAGMTPPVDQAV